MSTQRYYKMPSVTLLRPHPVPFTSPAMSPDPEASDRSRNSRGHALAGWHVPADFWPGWDLLRLGNANHVHAELFCAVNLVELCIEQLRISQKSAHLLARNNIFSRGCSPRFSGLGPYCRTFECLAPMLPVAQKDLSNDHSHTQRWQVLAQHSL